MSRDQSPGRILADPLPDLSASLPDPCTVRRSPRIPRIHSGLPESPAYIPVSQNDALPANFVHPRRRLSAWRIHSDGSGQGSAARPWDNHGRETGATTGRHDRDQDRSLARHALPARCDVRRRRHQLRGVLRGRRLGRARPLRRRRHRDPGHAARIRRVRLARLPPRREPRAALRLPRARPVRAGGSAIGATRTSSCSTRTRRPSRARSTGTSPCTATRSGHPTSATMPTRRRTR